MCFTAASRCCKEESLVGSTLIIRPPEETSAADAITQMINRDSSGRVRNSRVDIGIIPSIQLREVLEEIARLALD
jgi:hypothetical protein